MIRILDKKIADKIAAGEVVERPLSIVKELIENSFHPISNSENTPKQANSNTWSHFFSSKSAIFFYISIAKIVF